METLILGLFFCSATVYVIGLTSSDNRLRILFPIGFVSMMVSVFTFYFITNKQAEHLVCYDQSDRNMIVFDSGIAKIIPLDDGRWKIKNEETLYYTQIPGTICTVMKSEAPQGVESDY